MDIPIIDTVFGMESGYVLNFSNRTFANFFLEELGVDIYDDRWAAQGNSKANRLRCYLRRADRPSQRRPSHHSENGLSIQPQPPPSPPVWSKSPLWTRRPAAMLSRPS